MEPGSEFARRAWAVQASSGSIHCSTSGRLVRFHQVQKTVGIGLVKDQTAILRIGELFGYRAIELLDERIKVGIDIQQSDRLCVKAELSPRHDLTEFFKGSESAGQGDESVGNLDHHGLSFMHRANDPQFADIRPSDLTGQKSVGNDPDDLSAPVLYGLGNPAHHADAAAAVDQPDTAAKQRAGRGPLRASAYDGLIAVPGSAKNG